MNMQRRYCEEWIYDRKEEEAVPYIEEYLAEWKSNEWELTKPKIKAIEKLLAAVKALESVEADKSTIEKQHYLYGHVLFKEIINQKIKRSADKAEKERLEKILEDYIW